MRMLLTLLAALAIASPAFAQTNTPKPTHARLTMQQHFDQANVTHDGRLTLDQAQTGYKTVAKRFDAIDQDKKGYVTIDDIRAYYKMQRTLHQATPTKHAGTTE